jgi:trehalose 6-phosphate phosphatase
MERLFTPRGEAALEAVMRLDPVLAFDFDGTLAPIVDHPDDARVPAEIAQCLAELAERHAVAIISGRSVDDVRARLGFAPRFVIGNHGAEDDSGRLPEVARSALDALRARIGAAAPALVGAGVTVEDKTYSLALHYRRAADAALARVTIAALLDQLPRGLESFGGKFVVNVVAAGLPDKGDALTAIVRRCGADAACFVGDDVNDEAVFRRASARWLTIRIGGDAPGSQAMFFLDDIAELVLVLRRMRSLSSRV